MNQALALLLLAAGPAFASPPKYGPLARSLTSDHAYLSDPAHPAPDYWALSSFYEAQAGEASCSAAASAMALNALLNARRPRRDDERNITQVRLVSFAKEWQALVSSAGWRGRRGVTLEQLAVFLRAALRGLGASGVTVERHPARDGGNESLRALRRALAENERDPSDIILAHFVQDDLTGAAGGPFAHVSPLGAYDAAGRRVLVMDVDREWYEPYWVPDEALLRAMAHSTPAFGRGGFIRISRR
ncbi:MAG: phytochelatin synthase family protein [Elusimicrobia bacterium]|nr:phytochelatin synthase family protein [Elusimicrobiota bacterium]